MTATDKTLISLKFLLIRPIKFLIIMYFTQSYVFLSWNETKGNSFPRNKMYERNQVDWRYSNMKNPSTARLRRIKWSASSLQIQFINESSESLATICRKQKELTSWLHFSRAVTRKETNSSVLRHGVNSLSFLPLAGWFHPEFKILNSAEWKPFHVVYGN